MSGTKLVANCELCGVGSCAGKDIPPGKVAYIRTIHGVSTCRGCYVDKFNEHEPAPGRPFKRVK